MGRKCAEPFADLIRIHRLLKQAEATCRKLSNGKIIDFERPAKPSNKLRKAERRRKILQDQFDSCQKVVAAQMIQDEGCDWNESTIEVERRALNIFYGINNAFCKGHGHCVVRLRDGNITYYRHFGEPHGPQNFTNAQARASM